MYLIYQSFHQLFLIGFRHQSGFEKLGCCDIPISIKVQTAFDFSIRHGLPIWEATCLIGR